MNLTYGNQTVEFWTNCVSLLRMRYGTYAERSLSAEIVSPWKTPPIKFSGVIVTSPTLTLESSFDSPKQPASGASIMMQTRPSALRASLPMNESKPYLYLNTLLNGRTKIMRFGTISKPCCNRS